MEFFMFSAALCLTCLEMCQLFLMLKKGLSEEEGGLRGERLQGGPSGRPTCPGRPDGRAASYGWPSEMA